MDVACANPTCDRNRAGCTGDHIGPISLGFAHRPEFDVTCQPCNSARGNRMRLVDVSDLVAAEARGESIVSWFCRPLWDLRKKDVTNDETALRLGKLMNEQLNNAMLALHKIAEDGHYRFLIHYLHLEYSEYNVRFVNLRAENGRTRFDEIRHTRRNHEYVSERKARRIRVGFDTLKEFAAKTNRSVHLVTNPEIDRLLEEVEAALRQAPDASRTFDAEIHSALTADLVQMDASLRLLTMRLTENAKEPVVFNEARTLLAEIMNCIAEEISELWEHPKFVRAENMAL
jgi:hypothetical protein